MKLIKFILLIYVPAMTGYAIGITYDKIKQKRQIVNQEQIIKNKTTKLLTQQFTIKRLQGQIDAECTVQLNTLMFEYHNCIEPDINTFDNPNKKIDI